MKDNLSKIDGLISSQNTLNRVLVYGILYVIKSARWKSAVLMVQKAISIVQQIGKVLVEHIADKIGIISNGAIVREMTLQELKKDNSFNLEEYFISIVKEGER